MKKFLTTLCAVAIAAPLGFTAAPAFAQSGPFFGADLIQVQSRRDRNNRFERRGKYHYYNGRRGYRNHRPGYRQYNGFWFPPAAFALGAIISGAINNTAPRYRSGYSRSHVEWCYDRYRSYRASDNTFQPYNGGRRQCYSPYS
jgi:hypothetical protein